MLFLRFPFTSIGELFLIIIAKAAELIDVVSGGVISKILSIFMKGVLCRKWKNNKTDLSMHASTFPFRMGTLVILHCTTDYVFPSTGSNLMLHLYVYLNVYARH